MKSIFTPLARLLFPERCPVCRKVSMPSHPVCDTCFTKMTLLEDPIRREGIGSLDLIYSLYPYRHAYTKSILFSMKDRGAQNAVSFAAARMAEYVRQDPFLKNVTVVTYAPRRPGERIRMGFDQAALLAREIAARLSLPCIKALARKPGGRRQRGLTGEKRDFNVKDKFYPVKSCELSGNTVLLIDDVITTGATVRECASVLKLQMGAHKIYAFSFTSPFLKTEEE